MRRHADHNPDFVAVIDGATDKSGVDFGGYSGGQVVSSAVADALNDLHPETPLADAIGCINMYINKALTGYSFQSHERPCASAVIYSVYFSEIWVIGDQHYWIEDGPSQIGTKRIDQINSEARALMLAVMDELGAEYDGDPGRELIMPILKRQSVFANHPTSPYGYGVLNGLPIPEHLIKSAHAPQDRLVVLASDGYPRAVPTLASAEAALAHVIATDPKCIGENISTKGLAPGVVSYDDRSYVSFHAEELADQMVRVPASITNL